MADEIPYVSGLCFYPIKALDGARVERTKILRSGALEGDREFAIFDEAGNFVNGKRNESVHALRAKFDAASGTVALSLSGTNSAAVFHLEKERKALEGWLGEYFGFPVWVGQNLNTGFPDDLGSPGPTIVSQATLEAIASWYPDLDVEEMRRRFRANIEISGVSAFWEDRLFAEAEQTVEFQIGNVIFYGINPCQRCVVITRDSKTGEAYPNFQKTFVAKRRETLPEWVERSRFNHFYRLAINTRLPISEEGKVICLGDKVRVLRPNG